MEHEFVNASMSRAALSAESLLLRFINARAAHKSRSTMFEASVERESKCEKAFNCRAYLNRASRSRLKCKDPVAGMWFATRPRQTRQPFYEVTSDRSLTGTGCSQLEET
jgi:hypothetical protein